ncbi:MAG TPA: fumarylacetoacetase [Candidatus Sulfopaludibacter sp.]|jgi:fumarylacetoacetase|nr:fumarylacetoacetase [Candidatus Sulfopaludibacter sp.]
MTDQTHDPALKSWVESANLPGSDFPIQNLPFATCNGGRVGVAIGDQILDATAVFDVAALRDVMAMPREKRRELRRRISQYLAVHTPGVEMHLSPMSAARFEVACPIGDYSDFYASIHHATNVGSMFRPEHPLLPNYKWLPVGYHGRASSIVLSGSPIRRPHGQIAESPAGPPVYALSRRLDYELEVGAFLGPGNPLGQPIPIAEAADHIVGLCLLNDWSARDMQTWEYQPLGPFLAKSFATSISPWLVTMEALEPFRRALEPRPPGDPQPLPHLATTAPDAIAITLEVWLRSSSMAGPMRISRGNFAQLYWSLSQMVAHHSSNGCNLRPGDLIGSGTVSGPTKENRGCLLEVTWRGTEPIELPTGERRTFLEDGDEVILRGWCETPGYRRIGFGECRGVITG